RRSRARTRSRVTAIYAATVPRGGREARISALFLGWLGARGAVAASARVSERGALAALSRCDGNCHDGALSERGFEHRPAARSRLGGGVGARVQRLAAS